MKDEKKKTKVSTPSISWWKENNGLNEIYQTTGMQFSFVSSPKDGFKQCHTWVKCRDYLHDVVRTRLTGIDTLVFGFDYKDGVNPPADLRKMRMLVTKQNLTDKNIPEFKRKMASSLKLIRHFERHANMPLSTLKEVDPGESKRLAVFMFTGPAAWMKAPALVSMYTFLIRLGDKEFKFKNAVDLENVMKKATEDEKYSGDNDIGYLSKTWPYLHGVVGHRKELFVRKNGFDETYSIECGITPFHNQSGILNLIKQHSPNSSLNKRVKEILKIK